MALRRSARIEKKNREKAYHLGEVFMAAARQFWESGVMNLPWPVRRLERDFRAALKKCSEKGQVLVPCYLFDQPIPEGIVDDE
jgi:hypothetical protein